MFSKFISKKYKISALKHRIQRLDKEIVGTDNVGQKCALMSKKEQLLNKLDSLQNGGRVADW